MSTISVHRLRLPNGKVVKNPREYEEYILSMLKNRPCTPKEIAGVLQKSTKQVHRYLKNLKDSNKVVKIDGSDSYKLKSSKDDINSIKKQKIIENFTEFDNCQTIKNWRLKNKSIDVEIKIKWFRKLCFGQIVKDFKINPDFYELEASTNLIVSLLREKHGLSNGDLLPYSHRMNLRNFIIFGLGYSSLSKAEAEGLGISGEKTKPKLSTLHMTDNQYSEIKQILFDESNGFSEKETVLFGFRYGTFARPSATYLVKCADLKFYTRIVEYIEINGKKITNAKTIEILKKDYEVKEYEHRACSLELYEPKQDQTYPKHIFDEEMVNRIEAYTKKRINDGFKFLFWDNNDTVWQKRTYRKIVNARVVEDGKRFLRLLKIAKFPLDEVEGMIKANYFIRHFGVQKWLRETDYNLDFIAEMGWESTETLKTWYGKRTLDALQQKVSEIIF